MDSLEELPPVDSLPFLPEEVPSIFQDFQDIIHMDCSTEMNGRLHSSQYSNNEVAADEDTKRTASAALTDYDCTSCPVSSTLKPIKSREDKINENLNYLRSIKSSINRPYNHSNLYNKKYGGNHQQTICTKGSMANEHDHESRTPYFPHNNERVTADAHFWSHQYNNNNNNNNNSKCNRYNNHKNKRCMKSVSCSQNNSKGSSLAQLLCDIEPTQGHSPECSNKSTDNKYTYSKIKNMSKNNYVNPNKVLPIFEEDNCQHHKEEHVDCYDCSSVAMLDLIDNLPPELKKPNRHKVSVHSRLHSSPKRTNQDLQQNINVSRNINNSDYFNSIPKHSPPSVSSPINIHNKSCYEKDNSKNRSSLRLLLDPDDSGGSQNCSALRALLVSDNKNNKNGSHLRVLPVPNAPTMQQLLMSKEPIRVRGCASAVVNPSVLHNLLATGKDVLAGYSITPSASKTEEYIISRNSEKRNVINIRNIREIEDDETSIQNYQGSEFPNRVQNSSESPKNEQYGSSQVCPDFPINSKELIGPYSICNRYSKKAPESQNCRPTKVKCQSSTNTTSQSRDRVLFDTKESFNIDPSCGTFDNNQRIPTKHGYSSSHQRISTQENNKLSYPEEDMDNQDPLLDSRHCTAGLNLYRNTDDEAKEVDESAVGMNIYRNIHDDPDFSLPSLYDLAQQTDYELNTPPSSSNILQCSDLFMTLEHAF